MKFFDLYDPLLPVLSNESYLAKWDTFYSVEKQSLSANTYKKDNIRIPTLLF